jgi:hypothetical protein
LGWRRAYSIAIGPPIEMPSSANRSTPAASTTVSRSATCASSVNSGTVQSDNPQPRASSRSRRRPVEKNSNQCRQTGLCQSNSRCDNQFGAFTTGSPAPDSAYAMRTPSGLFVKRIV